MQSDTHIHTYLAPSVLTMFLAQLHPFTSSAGLTWGSQISSLQWLLFFAPVFLFVCLFCKIFYLSHQAVVRIKGGNAFKVIFLNYKGLYKREKVKKQRKLFIFISDAAVYLLVIFFMLRMFTPKWVCGKTFDHA